MNEIRDRDTHSLAWALDAKLKSCQTLDDRLNLYVSVGNYDSALNELMRDSESAVSRAGFQKLFERADREQEDHQPKDRWWKRINAGGERVARDGTLASAIHEAMAGYEERGWLRFAYQIGDVGAFDPEELDLRRQVFHWALSATRITILCNSAARYAEIKRLAERMYYLCRGAKLKTEEVAFRAFPLDWLQSLLMTVDSRIDVPLLGLQDFSQIRLSHLAEGEAAAFVSLVSSGKFCVGPEQPQKGFLGMLLMHADRASYESLCESCEGVVIVPDSRNRNDQLDLAVLAERVGDEPVTKKGVANGTQRLSTTQCKLLFLASNPEDQTQLDLDVEVREIEGKLREAEFRDKVHVISKLFVRPDDLLLYLNMYQPHIVHFSGHGNENEEILLLDKNRQSKPVSNSALCQMFGTLKDNIRVVILNACYSRPQAMAVSEVIDCVIGMKRAIGDEAAITFAGSFYRAIGFGRSVQEAFNQAKVSLMLEGINEEDTPVLHVRNGVDASNVFLVRG